MGKSRMTTFAARFVAAVMLAALAVCAQAQQADDDDLQPAVDTSAEIGPAVDTSAEQPQAAPAPQLAADVKREQSGVQVMDRLELERTEVTGNQELPKVLYIVPWQKSDPGELMGRPVNTLLDEVLAPIDREEFLRQVEYYDDLYGKK